MDSQTTIYIYLDCPIAICALVLVSLTIFILSRLKENSIFIYFKLESIFVLLDCFINALLPMYKCVWCVNPLLICILDQYGFNFLSQVFETCSLLLAIFVALTCLFQFYSPTTATSNNRFILVWSKMLKISPSLVVSVTFAFSFLLFSYELFIVRFEYDIISPTTNESHLFCYWQDDGNSPPFNILIIVSFAIAYGLLAFVLIIINLFIVFKIRSSLINERSANVLGPNITAKRRIAEKKLTRLILVDCFNIIVSRLSIFVVFVLMSTIDYSDDLPLSGLSNTAILVAYLLKFFIFYYFNKKFQCETRKLVCPILKFFKK